MPKQLTRFIPKLHTRAAFVPETLNADESTVELTWSTGSQVRRADFWGDSEWIEELSMNSEHVNLSRLNAGAPLLANHSNNSLTDVIGVVERAWLNGNEGCAKVRFSEREEVKPILADVKNGILRNISIGYHVSKFEQQHEKQNDLTVFRAIDWMPMEISLVPIPADAGAQVRSDGEVNLVTITEENIMADPAVNSQTDPSTALRSSSTAALATADEGTLNRSSVHPGPVTEGLVLNAVSSAGDNALRAEATKIERQRIAEIRKFGKMSSTDDTVVNDYVERGVGLQEAKDAMLEKWSARVNAETSRGDASVIVDARDKFIEAGVNALQSRAGIEKMDGGNEFRGMRLTEIAKLCLDRAGTPARGMNELEMVKRAFTQSTSDFPVLLETAMHKTLQGAYALAADTWSRFCKVGSVTDFRVHNRYRIGSFGNLDTVGELSEFKNKSIPDGEKSTIIATTKGNIINISRQTIINDDLGAFIGLSQMLGRAARRTIEADVYALLASNPVLYDGIVLFHADHGNLAGTAAVVSVTSLEAARIAMALQQDVGGNDYLDLRPALWLGPMSQGGQARITNEAQYDPDTTNKLQTPNRVRGLFGAVIDSPRITGTEWYLFADPGEAPVIEVAFLNGEQAPFLDNMLGFEVDGMQWKVRLDYGVAAIDYRGAVKNAGSS